jgi:AraC-like DNA-binding protein
MINDISTPQSAPISAPLPDRAARCDVRPHRRHQGKIAEMRHEKPLCAPIITKQETKSLPDARRAGHTRDMRIIEDVAGKDKSHAPSTSVPQHESIAAHDRQSLENLRHSKLYRDYERTFTEATGLPLALRPVEFFGLPFHGKTNENAFCGFLADSKSCSFCLQTQSCIAESPGEHPRSIQCPFGLTETAVPIRLGERVIGFLCTGQVFTRPVKLRTFKSPGQRLFPQASRVEQKGFRLWKATPFIEPTKYKAMVELLNFFAKQLSALSNQLFLEQKSREPDAVVRARQFIAANKRSQLSLASVAKAAGASMFHFCTLFRQTTGVKFSEYVARSRIEDARTLLCDRRLRMCEVAYEAGFQSMTAFNRAFRRIVGQSPTEYRHKLSSSRTRSTVASIQSQRYCRNRCHDLH